MRSRLVFLSFGVFAPVRWHHVKRTWTSLFACKGIHQGLDRERFIDESREETREEIYMSLVTLFADSFNKWRCDIDQILLHLCIQQKWCARQKISFVRSKLPTLACWSREKRARGVGNPIFKLYRYVPPHPHRVGFLGRFGLKTGIHFVYFGLE